MKYLRGKNINKDIDVIVGEMINTMSGITYYENGELCETPKPGYNSYTLNGVEYELHPATGNIYIFDTPENTAFIMRNLDNKLAELCARVSVKIGTLFNPNIAHIGTTQYLCITQINQPAKIRIMQVSQIRTDLSKYKGSFIWVVYDNKDYKAPIFNFNRYEYTNNYNADPAVTIIYDNMDMFTLHHNTQSLEYPTFQDYTLVKNKIIYSETINISIPFGVHDEILRYFIKKTGMNQVSHRMVDNVLGIYWIKWEDVNPIFRLPDMDWKEQVNNMEYPTQMKNLADDHVVSPSELKCFYSGLPIYDDCYVIDIYEQTVEIYVPVSSDLTNAKFCTEQSNTTRHSSVRRRTTQFENSSIVKHATKKGASKNKTVGNENTEAKQNPLPPYAITKYEEGEQYVKIIKKVKHDSPVHLLISPLIVSTIETDNFQQYIEKQLNAKIIIYRTRSPYTVKELISSLDADQEYKNILYAIEDNITVDGKDTMFAQYKDKKYRFVLQSSITLELVRDVTRVPNTMIVTYN